MTPKTKTTASEKSTAAAIRRVSQTSESHRKATEAKLKARTRLDLAILEAKENGATYRDIAAAAGVSTAWVQTALERCGYSTTSR